MGRFLAGENEELIRSFKPHPISFGASYWAATLWAAYGAGAWLAYERFSHPAVSWSVFGVLIVVHGGVRQAATGSNKSWGPVIAVAAAAGAAAAALAAKVLPVPGLSHATAPLLVGLAAAVASLTVREAARQSTSTFVTNLRLVHRTGVAKRTETIVHLKDVERVDTVQGLTGGVFGYGRIRLVKGKRRTRTTTRKRKKEREVETEQDDVLELRGVPRFEEAKRDVNDLVSEIRLSDRERQRRLEERRLRDSLQRLAQWRGTKAARHS